MDGRDHEVGEGLFDVGSFTAPSFLTNCIVTLSCLTIVRNVSGVMVVRMPHLLLCCEDNDRYFMDCVFLMGIYLRLDNFIPCVLVCSSVDVVIVSIQTRAVVF